jgi:hypothetical protein
MARDGSFAVAGAWLFGKAASALTGRNINPFTNIFRSGTGRNFGLWTHAINDEISQLPTMAAQEGENSCVIACMQEMLRRVGIYQTQDQIIAQFKPGTYSNEIGVTDEIEMWKVMQRLNPSAVYDTQPDGNTWDDVLRNFRKLPREALAWVKGPGDAAHAVLIEKVVGNTVYVSDPDPGLGVDVGVGKSATKYSLPWGYFQQIFRNSRSQGLFPK